MNAEQQLAQLKAELAQTKAELAKRTSAFSGAPVIVLKTNGKLRVTGAKARFEGPLSQAVAVLVNTDELREKFGNLDFQSAKVESVKTEVRKGRNGKDYGGDTYTQVTVDGVLIGRSIDQLVEVAKYFGQTVDVSKFAKDDSAADELDKAA